MSKLLDAVGDRLARFLTKPISKFDPVTTNGPELLRRTIQTGDVLLVEGNSRVSTAIKYLTQSTWSHAALYVGPVLGKTTDDGEPHVLVEAELGMGVISSPLSRHEHAHTRICRPIMLTEGDRQKLVDFAKERVGYQYDTRNVVDLLRFLMPTPPVPVRLRRKMLALGSGEPTRAICSTLIAQAFETVRYPILPRLEVLEQEVGLPAPFLFRKAQMPVHQMERTCRRFDDHDLGRPILAAVEPERNIECRANRPAREQQVAIPSIAMGMVELVDMRMSLEAIRRSRAPGRERR